MKKTDAEQERRTIGANASTNEAVSAEQPTIEYPTGNRLLDTWGPRFVNRAREIRTSLVMAIPLIAAFIFYLLDAAVTLFWFIVSGVAVSGMSVLFMMVICDFVRTLYVNEQDRMRAEAQRKREEEQRRREEEAANAAKQREATEAARLEAITQAVPAEESASADDVPTGVQDDLNLPELETTALCDAVLVSLSDAGVVLTRTDLLQLLAAMQASRVIRFSASSYQDMCRTAQALAGAFGNTAVKFGSSYELPIFARQDLLDNSAAPIKIIPLDVTDDGTANRLLSADRDKIRMPFVDEADRKKEFLPDMAHDNWTDCCVWYFVHTADAYTRVALDDWSVTLSIIPTVDAAERTAEPVASVASLQTLSGRAPLQSAGETFFDAVDTLDDFLVSSLHVTPANPLIRTAERFSAAALAAGFTSAEMADRFLACVRLPALLRGENAFTPDELTALGEKINALFGYDNVPLSRALLREAPHTVQTARSDNE